MWAAIALLSGLASLAGYALFQNFLTGHCRLSARLRRRCDPHNACGHDDARGLAIRRCCSSNWFDVLLDTGTIFGPHGGLLDRLDAVLFTIVAGYYLSVALVY